MPEASQCDNLTSEGRMNDQISTDPWRKPVGKDADDSADLSTQAESAATGAEQQEQHLLIVESGARPASFKLEPGGGIVVGRKGGSGDSSAESLPVVERMGPQSLVIRGNPHVSSRHARLEIGAHGGVFVTDLGSLNGTFIGSLDHQLRPYQPTRLNENDRLILCRQAQVVFVLRKGI